MIHHISLSARKPLEVAKVLVEILDGQLTRFGPHSGSYIAWAGDEYGTAIEVYPLGTELLPGPADEPTRFQPNDQSSTYSATHAALSIARSTDEVLSIAQRAGWRAVELSRGSFRVIELWIENRLLIEILTEEMKQEYLEATANLRRPARQIRKESSGGAPKS
ncbi:MAG: hypothetical protein K0U98_28460 [Deltaproteobacteria bacterium]|nr:hypothetical protein [Deltaproteobacteria bacterium]